MKETDAKPTATNPLLHVLRAARFSRDGIVACFRREMAFRLDCLFGLVHVPAAIAFPPHVSEKMLMLAAWFAVLVAEILNSALEEVVDAASPEWSEWAKRAKDYGSAAVFLSFCAIASGWCFVIWELVTAPTTN